MNHFKCTNHKCVDNSYVCDGRNDCGDYSDEDKGCQGKRAYFKSVFLLFMYNIAPTIPLTRIYLNFQEKIAHLMRSYALTMSVFLLQRSVTEYRIAKITVMKHEFAKVKSWLHKRPFR